VRDSRSEKEKKMVSSMAAKKLWVLVVVAVILFCGKQVQGIRFVIDKKECWSHEVQFPGDTVHVSFVVIKSENSWNYDHYTVGLDLIVEGPSGYQVQNIKQKTEEKFEFVAERRGLYKFCFFNLGSIHETVDFDVHIGHLSSQEHLKDEHFEPVMMQIERLEEAIYAVQFEQHWLQSQTDRQEVVNRAMSRRVLYKAALEAFALVGSSVLQVVLLRRLFERKLGQSRV
jgi:hypothetical protein